MWGQEIFGSTGYLIAIFFVILSLIFLKKSPGRKYLPGPYGLPIVGYLPFLSNKPYLEFDKLYKKYGPAYSLKLGSRYVIILCDYYTIKEAFSQDAFFGRPPDSTFQPEPETIKLEALQGMGFKEQRRFALHALRNLGFGKISMEQHMKDELHELLEEMEKHVGEPLSISDLLSPSVSNNISSLMFGKRRDFKDPQRVKLDRIVRDIGRLVGQAAWHGFFPWLRLIFETLHLSTYKKITKAFQSMKEYVRHEIDEHKKTLEPSGPRDFVDVYLMEIEKRKNQPGTTFTTSVLMDQVGGFFGAGSETIRLSLDWLLLQCAARPEVQERVHKEIDDIIGRDRFPTKTDDKQMPFTNAFMMETFRWKTLVPINILRYTLQDTELNSYFIPKNSYVIANLWSVHHDPKLWGDDHDEFKPERFLSEDGKQVRKSEFYIPFSIGKRSCPGETLAVTEIFLYLAAILQKFTVKLPEDTDVEYCFEGNLGIGLLPNPYKLILNLRK